MKAKLTLFAAILAVALFGMGCASAEPPSTALRWHVNAYMHYPEPVTWKEAQKKCERLGGHLVIIDSKEENDFIVTLFKGASPSGTAAVDHIWIGAYEDSNGVFKWVSPNGKKVSDTYNNWWALDPLPFKVGDPNYGRYALMAVASTTPRAIGGWTNFRSGGGAYNSFGKLGFICEWEKPKTK